MESQSNPGELGQNAPKSDSAETIDDVTAYNKEESQETSKRKREEVSQSFGDQTVAKHYNELQEQGRDKRTESRIFYLRNFNNWIKSMLINEAFYEIKRNKKIGEKLVVMDLCCGKGGDLLKWKKASIHHLICADIAGTSVEQCQARYDDMSKKSNGRIFSAEFITCDCTRVRLKDHIKHQDLVSLVSCQFSFHYCFESYAQADMMMRNVSENLKTGGYFIGTTPDAYEIVKRLQASDTNSFGNDVYKITFPDGRKDGFSLFGARYNFHLEGVVDCPEFLVNFPALEKLAQKYGLKPVYRKPFAKFAEKYQATKEGRQLLERMKALETYPAESLAGNADTDYEHAKQTLAEVRSHRNDSHATIGTLSLAEWEAASVYLVFVFEKLATPESTPTSSQPTTPTTAAENL